MPDDVIRGSRIFDMLWKEQMWRECVETPNFTLLPWVESLSLPSATSFDLEESKCLITLWMSDPKWSQSDILSDVFFKIILSSSLYKVIRHLVFYKSNHKSAEWAEGGLEPSTSSCPGRCSTNWTIPLKDSRTRYRNRCKIGGWLMMISVFYNLFCFCGEQET